MCFSDNNFELCFGFNWTNDTSEKWKELACNTFIASDKYIQNICATFDIANTATAGLEVMLLTSTLAYTNTPQSFCGSLRYANHTTDSISDFNFFFWRKTRTRCIKKIVISNSALELFTLFTLSLPCIEMEMDENRILIRMKNLKQIWHQIR